MLLGEATHGTSEFYRMRERITRALIVKKGFNFIGIEGDWPDAARIDHYVRHLDTRPPSGRRLPAFQPGCGATTRCALSSIGCERTMDGEHPQRRLPSTASISTAFNSIRAVLRYLEDVDPESAGIARTVMDV